MRLLTIFLLILLALTIQASSHDVVDQLHKQAYELLDVDLDSAMKIAEQSLKLSEKEDYQWGIANSYYIKGYIHRQQNKLAMAQLMYLKAINIFNHLGGKKAAKTYLDVLLNSGSIFRKYYKYDEAIEFYNKGLELADIWIMEKQKLKLLINKSSALQDKGELDNSLEVLKEAVGLAYQLEDSSRLIKCWNLIGLVHKDSQFYEMAREYYHYILSSPSASEKDKAAAYHNIAVTFNEENQFDTSREYFEMALGLKRSIDEPQLLFSTLYELTNWHMTNNDTVNAMSYALEAEQFYPELEKLPEVFSIYHFLHLIFRNQNDFDKANNYSIKYYEESQTFYTKIKEIMRAKDELEMDLILAGFETEQKAEAQQKISRQKVLTLSILLAVAGMLLVYIYIKRHFFRRELTQVIKSIQ
ncbi:MAG: tetratricopeptide repeat protein [Cytophagales bacterium]|nr:tetratricopeptide repeat protein [Cytophagales bacterium]